MYAYYRDSHFIYFSDHVVQAWRSINPLLCQFKSVAFSLSNTRVYFSIFVFSFTLVTIRVVHLMEQCEINKAKDYTFTLLAKQVLGSIF